MTGEPSLSLCALISARIRRSVSAAAATRWDAVAGGAVLLGSAIDGPGFDRRGSRDVAIDMMFRCIMKKKKVRNIKKKVRCGKIRVILYSHQTTKSRRPEPWLQAFEI